MVTDGKTCPSCGRDTLEMIEGQRVWGRLEGEWEDGVFYTNDTVHRYGAEVDYVKLVCRACPYESYDVEVESV